MTKKDVYRLFTSASILGSGDFVANVMKDANEVLDQTAKFDVSLDELISMVCAKLEIRVKDLMSKSRKRCLSQARGVVCYLAVDEPGYMGDDVAGSLRIKCNNVPCNITSPIIPHYSQDIQLLLLRKMVLLFHRTSSFNFPEESVTLFLPILYRFLVAETGT